MFSEKERRTNAYHDNVENNRINEYKNLKCPNCTSKGKIQFIHPEDLYFHTHDVECRSCGSVYCIGLEYYPVELNRIILENIKTSGLNIEEYAEKNDVNLEHLREIQNGPTIYSYDMYVAAGKILGKSVDELTELSLQEYDG